MAVPKAIFKKCNSACGGTASVPLSSSMLYYYLFWSSKECNGDTVGKDSSHARHTTPYSHHIEQQVGRLCPTRPANCEQHILVATTADIWIKTLAKDCGRRVVDANHLNNVRNVNVFEYTKNEEIVKNLSFNFIYAIFKRNIEILLFRYCFIIS